MPKPTGGAVAVMLIRGGMNPWLALIFAFLAGMAAGFVTGILHTALGIPGILASILTQISLYSINLNIMGCSNQAVSVDKYNLVVSLRYVSDSTATKIRVFTTCILFCVVVVAILYWYFGTEQGHAIRATGCNKQIKGHTFQHDLAGLQLAHIQHLVHQLQQQGGGLPDLFAAVCLPCHILRAAAWIARVQQPSGSSA